MTNNKSAYKEILQDIGDARTHLVNANLIYESSPTSIGHGFSVEHNGIYHNAEHGGERCIQIAKAMLEIVNAPSSLLKTGKYFTRLGDEGVLSSQTANAASLTIRDRAYFAHNDGKQGIDLFRSFVKDGYIHLIAFLSELEEYISNELGQPVQSRVV